jgi:hypothetical protein
MKLQNQDTTWKGTIGATSQLVTIDHLFNFNFWGSEGATAE